MLNTGDLERLKTTNFSLYETINPAPTGDMIKYVNILHNKGYIDFNNAYHLNRQLINGEIIHPLWEDYGFKTNVRGLPVIP